MRCAKCGEFSEQEHPEQPPPNAEGAVRLTAEDARSLLDYYKRSGKFLPSPLLPFLLAVESGRTATYDTEREVVVPRGRSVGASFSLAELRLMG